MSEGVLGHKTVHAHLQSFLAGRADVRGWFATVPAPGRLGARAVKRYPRVGSLDMFELRWRLRWSMVARHILEKRARSTDAVLVNTQSCGLLLYGECRSVPCVLSVDATGLQYAQLAYYRPRDRFSGVGDRAIFALERRAYEHAHRILAWTDWVAGSLQRDYGIDPAKIVRLHPGAPMQALRALPPDSGAPVSPLRAIFIGNEVERKGLDVLLEAVRKLDGEVLLDVVTSAAVPVAPHVTVHRGVETGSERFLTLLSSADVLVLPTRADAVPWVLIEAMAAGLAVITTPVGAIPEVVGQAGIIVPPGDSEAIALQLAGLAADSEQCAERGRLSRLRAEERYDAAEQLPKLLDLMKEAAASRPAPGGSPPRSRRRAPA